MCTWCTCLIAPLGDHKEKDGACGLRCARRKTELVEIYPEDLALLLMRIVRCPGTGRRSETRRDVFLKRPSSECRVPQVWQGCSAPASRPLVWMELRVWRVALGEEDSEGGVALLDEAIIR